MRSLKKLYTLLYEDIKDETYTGVPQADIDLCLEFHKFNFVIKKVVENNLMYLIKEDL